ncbi:MAG: MarR family transcriptional regulator [Chitinophagaceae bacterium]|nr:MarR family transcriptional regulator [Chitinophagaceae bacterium]
MSIEKDIQQARFNNEYHKMNVNLIFTYNWVMEQSRKFYEKADLTPQQYNILRILRGASAPLSTLQIRQRMLDKMSDTSRIVDRLVKKELVEKVISKTDRRLVDVTISDKGRQLLNQLDQQVHELDSQLTGISEEEARTMNTLLDKLRRSS